MIVENGVLPCFSVMVFIVEAVASLHRVTAAFWFNF